MRVLVTGATGFIGTYVREALTGWGHEVLAFDHHRASLRDAMILGDVRDATAVTEAMAHAEGVIHLAAVLGTQETIQNPRPAVETNILGTLNVIDAALQYGLPMVYVGVGNHWMRDHGTGGYTISKTCAEDFCRSANAFRGADISIVRPVNAYGPRQSVAAPFGTSKVRKIVPSFACRALSCMPIEVYGDGEQISDMIFVEDVARTMVAALGCGITAPIGVGPVRSHTVNEVAEIVRDAAARITGTTVPIVHLPMRPGEVPNATVSADTTLLKGIGIDPEEFADLEWGLMAAVAWYADKEGTVWRRPSTS